MISDQFFFCLSLFVFFYYYVSLSLFLSLTLSSHSFNSLYLSVSLSVCLSVSFFLSISDFKIYFLRLDKERYPDMEDQMHNETILKRFITFVRFEKYKIFFVLAPTNVVIFYFHDFCIHAWRNENLL